MRTSEKQRLACLSTVCVITCLSMVVHWKFHATVQSLTKVRATYRLREDDIQASSGDDTQVLQEDYSAERDRWPDGSIDIEMTSDPSRGMTGRESTPEDARLITNDISSSAHPRPRQPTHIRSFQYSYTVGNETLLGKPFTVDLNELRELGYPTFPMTSFAPPLTPYESGSTEEIEFVFVTGSSYGHFAESRDLVASIQTHHPGRTILYYDWGLKDWQVHEIRSWCNVHYTPFNLTSFNSIQTLREKHPFQYYFGKVLTIAHALQDHHAVMWLDASVRFLHGNLTEIYRKARENGGLVFFSRSRHNIATVTHPRMYEYLVSDYGQLKRALQMEAVYFIYNSEKIYNNILLWLHLCALERDCLSPVYNLTCHVDNTSDSYGCHRYDQSAINILALNYFGYQNNGRNYWVCSGPQGTNAMVINRKVTHMYDLQTCSVDEK